MITRSAAKVFRAVTTKLEKRAERIAERKKARAGRKWFPRFRFGGDSSCGSRSSSNFHFFGDGGSWGGGGDCGGGGGGGDCGG